MALVKMTAKTLNAIKGWPRPHALDFVAKLDAASTIDPLPQGSVVHLTADKTFLPGVGNSAVMPLFTFPASDDPDVANNTGGDPATDKGAYVPVSPIGGILALVATGAYELVSTNFDAQVSYAPNDHLTSPTTTAGGVNAGTLKKGTRGTNCICGIVSRGVINNGYGTDALAFWSLYLPPTP